MPKLNSRQQEIVKSIAAARSAGRGVVIQFEQTLLEYWGKDRRSCDNLSFFLTATKNMKHTQSAMRKLLPSLVPVTVKKVKGEWCVENIKDVSKRQKAKMSIKTKEFCSLKLTSLLNHPSLKVEVAFDWSKRAVSLEKQLIRDMLEHGVSADDVLSVLEKACNAVAKEQAKEIAALEAVA